MPWSNKATWGPVPFSPHARAGQRAKKSAALYDHDVTAPTRLHGGNPTAGMGWRRPNKQPNRACRYFRHCWPVSTGARSTCTTSAALSASDNPPLAGSRLFAQPLTGHTGVALPLLAWGPQGPLGRWAIAARAVRQQVEDATQRTCGRLTLVGGPQSAPNGSGLRRPQSKRKGAPSLASHE